jgi:hypothetical protein
MKGVDHVNDAKKDIDATMDKREQTSLKYLNIQRDVRRVSDYFNYSNTFNKGKRHRK